MKTQNSSFMKIRIFLALVLFAISTTGYSQILFSNTITATNPGLSNPFINGQVVASNLTVSGIGRGPGANYNPADDRYNANGWKTNNLDPTAYFEFKLTPNASYQLNFLSLVYASQSSATGPVQFAVRSNMDSFTTDIPRTVVGAQTTVNLASAAFQNVATEIVFRIYAWRANADAGTFAIDNFEFTGSATTSSCDLTTSITPVYGPVGTIVTVTATTGNLLGAVALIDGIPATVVPVNDSQILVTIPAAATSGQMIITNADACTATKVFTVLKEQNYMCQGATIASDLFISEVSDSTYGTLVYLEIYNGTGATVNLGNYSLKSANNGGGYQLPLALTNVPLANGDTYVVAYYNGTSCSIPGGDGSYANQTTTSGGINFTVNGNDHIGLFKNGNLIDSFGVYNSSSWADILAVEGDGGVRFIRKITANAPSVTHNNADWNITDFIGTGSSSCTSNDYSTIGSHQFKIGLTPKVTLQPEFVASCVTTTLTVAATEGFVGGYPLTYQWFYAKPGVSTWTIIAGGPEYTDFTTATLKISNITEMDNYQFYVEVRENTSSCSTVSNPTVIKVHKTTWNGTSWSSSAPTSSSLVTINGLYNTAVHGNMDACRITVNSGATLSVSANQYVSLVDNLEVQYNGVLNIESSGSFVMQRNSALVANNGITRVKRNTTPYKKYDYTYWSSPVTDAYFNPTFTTPGFRLDYAFTFKTSNYSDLTQVDGTGGPDGFDDNSDVWIPIATPTTKKGVGYAIMGKTTGTFPVTSTVIFNGALNNGIITVPIEVSANTAEANDDFNLIGNPYPSSIDANMLLLDNSAVIENALYFWTHRTAISSSAPGPQFSNFVKDDYAMYNLSGGTASDSGSLPPSRYIASGQGFIAEGRVPGTLTFRNEMRSKTQNNSAFWKSAEEVRDRVWLNFESLNGLFSQQLVGYFPETTNDVDWGYDGAIMPSQNTVSFYSLIDDKTFRIQGRAPFTITDEVPLGYKSLAGEFTISIYESEGELATTDHIYLEDNLLGVVHDLKQSSYNFETASGTFNDRFVLKYTTDNLSTNNIIAQNNLESAVYKNQVMLKSTEMISAVRFYDMLGKLVYSAQVDDLQFTTPAFSTSGVLVMKVIFESGRSIDRKIIL